MNEYFLAAAETLKNIDKGTMLFKTDAKGLYGLYLKHAPKEIRGSLRCEACKAFIRKYGSLVTVKEDGSLESFLWTKLNKVNGLRGSFKAMKKAVEKGKITMPFYSNKGVLGTNSKGDFTHFAVRNHAADDHPTKKQHSQLQAYNRVLKYSKEFAEGDISIALSLLRSKSLGGGEHLYEDMGTWLKHTVKIKHTNLLWLRVVEAPTGFTHIKTNTLGKLLKDISEGDSPEVLKRKFSELMDPERHKVVVRDLTNQQVDLAYALLQEKGAVGSLKRRPATNADIERLTFWKPEPPTPPSESEVFDAVRPTKDEPLVPSGINNVSWTKFKSEILPMVQALEVLGNEMVPVGLMAPEDPDAPSIFKGGEFLSAYSQARAEAADWNLETGGGHVVTSIITLPTEMVGPSTIDNDVLIIEGMRPTDVITTCIFADSLADEYREIKDTITKNSAATLVEVGNDAVCGAIVSDVTGCGTLALRVLMDDTLFNYKITSWD